MAPVGLVILGAAVHFLAFPSEYGGLDALTTTIERTGVAAETPLSVTPERRS